MLALVPVLLLTFFGAAPLTSALPISTSYPWSPVNWVVAPRQVRADSRITLSWDGGSGNGYEVYYIPDYDGQDSYKAVDIASTSMKSVVWQTPPHDAYPEGTTFIIAVSDVNEGRGSVWYDLTGQLPFVPRN